MLAEADKFIDFIKHVDKQNKTTVKASIQELDSMNTSGVELQNQQRYTDLKSRIEEHEAEVDLRDLSH